MKFKVCSPSPNLRTLYYCAHSFQTWCCL